MPALRWFLSTVLSRCLFSQGLLIKEHKKISKRSNPLAPDPLVKRHGADAVRLYLMFIGPWDQGGDWNDAGIAGITRFLNRVWDLARRDPARLATIAIDETGPRKRQERQDRRCRVAARARQ